MEDMTREISRTKRKRKNQNIDQFPMELMTASRSYSGIMQCLDGGFFFADKVAKGVVATCALPGAILPAVQVYAADIAPENGVTVYDGDKMTLPGISTTTVTDVTLSSGGIMDVSAGGTANGTTVSGPMYLYSGGMATGTMVKESGSLGVGSGATANSTTVNFSGYMTVAGIASNTIVNSGGTIKIVSEGTVTDITANDTGCIYISSGGTTNNANINNGFVSVDAGGELSNTIITGNSSHVLMYGTADSTTINDGEMSVVAGIGSNGVASNTQVNGGWLSVSYGGTAISTSVHSGGSFYIGSGGTAIDTEVSGGQMGVSAGGSANSTTVNAGSMTVGEGATATSTTMVGGYMSVKGMADSTRIDDTNAAMHVSDNGVANSTIIDNGQLTVDSGGTANSTIVNQNGSMTINNGGVANSTIVYGDGNTTYYGIVNVSSGGSATSTNISGGRMTVFEGATAISTTVDGALYINGKMAVSSGGTANDTTVTPNASLTVYNGGVANNTTVYGDGNSAYDNGLIISSGGRANNTTVSSGGLITVYKGGLASKTTILNDSMMLVGGVVSDTIIENSDGIFIGSGASAYDSVINNGSMKVHGGTATSTTVNSGSLLHAVDGGKVSATIANSGGEVRLSTNGVASGTTVNGGQVNVSAGGNAIGTDISAGSMTVYGNASATSTIIGGGSTTVYGMVDNTTINAGMMYVSSGGVANSTLITQSATMNIYSGGVANDIILSGHVDPITSSDPYNMYIFSGGVVNGTVANSGSCMLLSGGTANSTTLNSDTYLRVEGGDVNDTIINGGALDVRDSGFVSNTIVNYGNLQLVGSETSATSTTINSGGNMYATGITTHTIINSGGNMRAAGNISSTTVHSDGSMTVEGTATTATSTTVHGSMAVRGGTADETVIQDGGTMRISADVGSSLKANNTIIHDGGNMLINNYATTTRLFEINDVTMSGGTITNNWTSQAPISGTVSGYGTLNGSAGFSFPGAVVVDGGTLIGDNAPISADTVTIKDGNIATDSDLTVSNTLTVKTVKDTNRPAITAGSFSADNIDVTAIDTGTTSSGTLLQTNTALPSLQLTSNTLSGTLSSVSDSVVFGGGALTDTSISGFTLNYIAPKATYTMADAKNVTYTLNGGYATKLTFGSIPWLDNGAFINHNTKFADISFTGADVDTTNIHFNNVSSLNANKVMTLVSNFGTSVGTIIGTKYTVGTTLQGNGKASLTSGNDLIYTVETTANGSSGSGSGSSSSSGSGSGSGSGTSGGSGGSTPSPAIVTPATVNNNTVNVSGDKNGDVYGGQATDTASGNIVNITGGTVSGNVYGGYAGRNASDNTVNITGGAVRGNVYGGYSMNGETRNNTITIFGPADLSAANLYGGNRESTGNVLNIGDAATKTPWTGGDQKVKNLSNFSAINFHVVPWSTNQPALTITDGSQSDLSYTTVGAESVHFANIDILKHWDTMTLLDESSIADDAKKLIPANIRSESDYTVGTTGQGKGTVYLDKNGNVRYRVDTDSEGTPIVAAQEQTHNTLMGMEASLAVLDAGRDFIGKAAESLTDSSTLGEDGISTFAAMGGGTARYETGSHIRANTWNGILGIGTQNKSEQGSVEWGAFVEHGSGKYSLHGGNTSYGDGTAAYTGGGLLGRWTNANDSYVEGSFRMGRVHDSASNVLRDVLGNSYGYNVHANYYGGHLGVGRVYHLGEGRDLDVYGKFFYTKRDGVSFDAGGRYELDALNSNVLRVGARYSAAGKRWNWYGGLAYEHEFDGEASGTADGAKIRSASIRGGSVRAELGIQMKPSETSPWEMNIGLSGYAGKHRGINGTVGLSYHF